MAKPKSRGVPLPAIVDLDACETVREDVLTAVDTGTVAIDGSQVERIATNALVMLLAGAETARRCNCKFSIEKPSESMSAAIERLGMTEHFAEFLEG